MGPYFLNAACCRYNRAYALLWWFCPVKKISSHPKLSPRLSSLCQDSGLTYGVDMSNYAYVTDVLHCGLIMSRHVRPSLRRASKTGPTLSRAKPRHHSIGEHAGKAF